LTNRQLKISAKTRWTMEPGRARVEVLLELCLSSTSVQDLPPLYVCFVIDISGSMRTAVTNEVSKSDLVRRAVSACLDVLQRGDRACLVMFNGGTKTYDWAAMDAAGKGRIRQTLLTVADGGQTDITGALREAQRVMAQVPAGCRG
jgi:Mg-chelatase subunit ChlD